MTASPTTAKRLSPAERREQHRRDRLTGGPAEPLTWEQGEAARLGHPGLTAQDAAFYVHQSERYIYDRELYSRDAMPEDLDAQYRWEREQWVRERREPGGRFRHAMVRREAERLCLPSKRRLRQPADAYDEIPF